MAEFLQERLPDCDFSQQERDAVYRAIFSRRDVRREFTDRPIDDATLHRLLTAAHHAPSVGFMQPWNFVVIRQDSVKERVHAAFEKAHHREAEQFDSKRRTQYRKLKLEGIRESPVNLCITCDRSRHGPVVLGKTANASMDLYSTVCAVQNLWLAARSEGIGVGWVSIVDEMDLKEILQIPDGVIPIAYLCVGYVEQFATAPDLERAKWLPRLDLNTLIFQDRWGHSNGEHSCESQTNDKVISEPRSEPTCLETEQHADDLNAIPSIKRITLVRHASTLENEQRRYIGTTDAELSERGEREAASLACQLSDQNHDCTWVSPLKRTRQTWDALGRNNVGVGAEVELDILREIDFGNWEGRTFQEVAQEFPEDVEQWNQQGEAFRFPGGESIASFRDRVDTLIDRISSENASSFLIVTHGGVIRQIICRLLKLPIEQAFSFKIDPASVTTIEWSSEHAVLTSLNVQTGSKS